MNYSIDFFQPKEFSEVPLPLELYRKLEPGAKEEFMKKNPDYFRNSQGGEYLDECEGIKAENTRNLVFLLDARDIGDKDPKIDETILKYFGKPVCHTLAPRKYWEQIKVIVRGS
jgi:hypothetical protein